MTNHLDSFDMELNQSQFFRMFALGCFDSFITLPITITGLVGNIVGTGPLFSFYQGWTFMHSNWEPELFPKSMWSSIKWNVFSLDWDKWVNPFWALVFFSLFGLTTDARKGYRRVYRLLIRHFSVRPAESMKESLPDMFGIAREASMTATSNVSNRYGLSLPTARKHFLI